MDLTYKEMAEFVDAEDKKLSGIKFNHSPEVMQKIKDALKPTTIVEVLPEGSAFIEEWKIYMDEEVVVMYTANKDGIRPLCNDGSVYFGLGPSSGEEMHLVRELNGVPHNPKPHISEHWLMQMVKPVKLPWAIYDNNMKQTYGPFADVAEAVEFIEDQNFSVEGVWRAQ